VHFSKKTSYYAVLQTNGPLNRSVLFLYDTDGKITYQEIIAESCSSISSMPGKMGDRLLIGCSGDILEYSSIRDGVTAQDKNDAGSR
jgi:hypothetical protein